MPDYCTCGAQLPPDALFCHKCGKPQRDLPIVEMPPEQIYAAPIPEAPEQLLAKLAPQPVSFHNPVAVRVALSAASCAILLSWIPYLGVLVWVPAGVFAAYLYARRTGQALQVKNGARLGCITGVLGFAIFLVIFTAMMVMVRMAGGFSALPQDQLNNPMLSPERMKEVLKTFQDPVLIMQLLFSTFLLTTLLCTAGGALGAKIVGRE